MLVRDWMCRKAVTVDVEDSLQKAINLMTDNRVGMLPVLDGGRLVGIVTDRDLRRASPSDTTLMDVRHLLYHMQRVQMGTIMSPNPVTVTPDTTMEEVAQTLLQRNISGCPVVDQDGRLRGVITKNDIFKAIVALSGLSKKGIQFGLLVEDRPGSIKEVADVIRDFGGRLASILTTYENAPRGRRYAYLRTFSIDRDSLPELEKALQEKAELIYMVDHRENKRVIFKE